MSTTKTNESSNARPHQPSNQVRLEGRIKLSVAMAVVGFATLAVLSLHDSSLRWVGLTCVGSSVAHFLLMETDHKLKLHVRPFGLLPIPMVTCAITWTLIERTRM